MIRHRNPRHEVRWVSYVAAFFLAGGISAAPGTAQEARPPIDDELARAYFDEARELAASSPWPDLYGPILFVEPTSRYVVANRPDPGGRLRLDGQLYTGTLPAEVLVANTATTWADNRWSMLMWPVPEGFFARGVLLAHEMFHRLGPEIGLPMANPVNEHLDTMEGRLWLRLELRALAVAPAAAAPDRARAVADALAFRSRRHSVLPASVEDERSLELNEGLAEYTGVRTALPAAARHGWAARSVEAHEVQASREGVTRTFAYATGLAYGLLLDDAAPGWTTRLDSASDLAGLAAAAYGFPAHEDRGAEARSRMAAYGGARVERFEVARAAERAREQAAYRTRYVEDPILRLPVDGEFNVSFDPNDISTLEGVGQILSETRITAGWGSLIVTNGVLLERTGHGIVGIVVPAPTNTVPRPIVGDGWTLSLAAGWTVVPGDRDGDMVVRLRQ